ncbi:GH39 family glycosyl hydrolase [Plantibacter sp. Mn2098]|uniref:GH39 family glycosyl hydrolase n=1 Tax=Plantibacter sp. Mn2098 TaxID=3395266 RepID=UPI003BD08E25
MQLTLDLGGALDAKPLDHFWNRVVGAGRANEGLRADWQEQLRFAKAHGGFEYLRFHGLFHDDMFVYREVDGVVTPYFQYVDLLFDAVLDAGLRPFVEFGFSPPELARETKTVFWWGANGSPPTDNVKWAQLVRATVEHWVERYGIEEVREWYFEIWNEPNLDPFFRGTKAEYFELYRVSVEAIKAVSGDLRVGGPATSNFVPDARFDGETEDTTQHAVVLEAEDLDALDWKPVWLADFLVYCHERSLPVDFVSCHPYPTDWALDEHNQGRKLTRGVDATPTDLRTLRALVDASPYPDAEIHLTEWNSSSSPRDYTHDYTQAATYVVQANLQSIGLVDSLAYWTFTDVFEESGAGQEPFHGGFGMLNQHGIPKPTMHAYRMLAALGDELVHQQDGTTVTRFSASGEVAAIVTHYPPEVRLSVPASFDTRDVADRTLATGRDEPLDVVLHGLRPGAVYTLEVLDPDHGSAMREWERLGFPNNLSRADVASLRRAAEATLTSTHTVEPDGTLRIATTLAPWSVALLAPARIAAP